MRARERVEDAFESKAFKIFKRMSLNESWWDNRVLEGIKICHINFLVRCMFNNSVKFRDYVNVKKWIFDPSQQNLFKKKKTLYIFQQFLKVTVMKSCGIIELHQHEILKVEHHLPGSTKRITLVNLRESPSVIYKMSPRLLPTMTFPLKCWHISPLSPSLMINQKVFYLILCDMSVFPSVGFVRFQWEIKMR